MGKVTVEYSLGRTLNIEKFESVKIHVGVSLECDGSSRDDVERAYAKAKKFVKSRVEEEEMEWTQ